MVSRGQPLANTIAERNSQLARFQHIYNRERPYRALNRRTPNQAHHALAKAEPFLRDRDEHWRVRYVKIDNRGTITIRNAGKFRHLGIGRAHKNTPAVLLLNGAVAIVTTRLSGEILAEHTINPGNDYQNKNT